jgi:hypothetical protein
MELAEQYIDLYTSSTKFCCNSCGKKYIRKLSLDRHQILCEFMLKTAKTRKIEEEESESMPSYINLVKIVQELAIKCQKLEDDMSEMRNFINRKKKKIDIKTWLCENIKPIETYCDWATNIAVIDSHLENLIHNNLIQTFHQIIETNLPIGESNLYPVKCFVQKQTTFYIYVDDETKWRELAPQELLNLFQHIQQKLLSELGAWKIRNQRDLEENDKMKEIYNKMVIKLMSIPFTVNDAIFTKLRSNMFQYLKTDLKRNFEYEFEY